MSKTSCREIDLLMIDTIAGRHWLHPEERMKGKLEEIRTKHRQRYLARIWAARQRKRLAKRA